MLDFKPEREKCVSSRRHSLPAVQKKHFKRNW